MTSPSVTSPPAHPSTRRKYQAKEAVAVTIVGHGNNRNMWNGYAEVELCAREAAVVETPTVGVEPKSTNTAPNVEVELPFADGTKGFNIINM